jgi:hypothetical protein
MSQAWRKTIVIIASTIFAVMYLYGAKDKKKDYVSLAKIELSQPKSV